MKATEPPPLGIIVIGGFRQDLGLIALVEALCQLFPSRITTRIYSRRWNVPVSSLANEIRRAHDTKARLVGISFSWGNPTMIALARELAKSGHRIERLVMCDPVPRALGFLPIGSLKVPANVRNVEWLYQKNMPFHLRVLQGKRPVADDPQHTTVTSGIAVPFVSHVFMDDTPEFFNAAISAVAPG